MGDEIVIEDLARRTKNFTGAEIAGFCRSAASFALNRQVDPLNPQKRPDLSKIRLTPGDFNMALGEVGWGARGRRTGRVLLLQNIPNGLNTHACSLMIVARSNQLSALKRRI